jgi:hypothetical protein
VVHLPYRRVEVSEDSRTVIDSVRIQADDFIEVENGEATYLLAANEGFEKTYPWEYTLTRSLEDSLLIARLSCLWGEVMFPTGLGGLKVLSAAADDSETAAANIFPSLSSRSRRQAYRGPAAGVLESGNPQQIWWQDVVFQGRLGDINRALRGLT